MAIVLLDSDSVGFSDGGSGHVYNYPLGAPNLDDLDILAVNSDTTVSTPSGFTLRRSEVANQGSYIFSRKAVGGEAASTTITTAGDFRTTLTWHRFSGTDAFDVATGAQLNTAGTASPAVNTGALAGTGDELVYVFEANHQFAVTPNTPVWSAGYTPTETVSQTTGPGNSVNAFSAYRTNAGPAAETPSVTWTDAADHRYMLVAAFTADAVVDTVIPNGIAVPVEVGSPTVVDGSMTVVPDGIAVPVALGSPTVTGPPGPSVDQLLLPVAQELLSCLCTALTELTTPPGICCIRVGDEATQDMGQNFDECCEGMAYVRIDGFYPTGGPDSPFPSPSSDFALSKCAPYAWGLSMEMGVFRCMNTEGVTCDEWGLVAAQQMADARAMRQALCCFMQPRDGGDVAVGTWTPKGPDGGCIGSIWQITAMVINRCEGC